MVDVASDSLSEAFGSGGVGSSEGLEGGAPPPLAGASPGFSGLAWRCRFGAGSGIRGCPLILCWTWFSWRQWTLTLRGESATLLTYPVDRPSSRGSCLWFCSRPWTCPGWYCGAGLGSGCFSLGRCIHWRRCIDELGLVELGKLCKVFLVGVVPRPMSWLTGPIPRVRVVQVRPRAAALALNLQVHGQGPCSQLPLLLQRQVPAAEPGHGARSIPRPTGPSRDDARHESWRCCRHGVNWRWSSDQFDLDTRFTKMVPERSENRSAVDIRLRRLP